MESAVCQNPVVWSDYPDPDVIRAGDVYYMVSTTMHFMPGAVILRSYDLVHWEFASYVYDALDSTPAQKLEGEKNIYGKGMWAASLRLHNGTYSVCFIANDTHKTYLYRAESIEGPWKKQNIEGFYHDSSLLFDDDGRVYIVHGNREIHLTELKEDLTGPKPGGLDRSIVKDRENVLLGYEGSHFYKIDGRYYVFFIHWPADGTNRRVEACFSADSLTGDFTGGNVFDDNMDFCNDGIAQGGIVDTPDGDWYAMLFQDRGAVGRCPVLVPVRFENGVPVFGVNGRVPRRFPVKSTRPGYEYEPLTGDDDFRYRPDGDGGIRLKSFWQWNHEPDGRLWSVTQRPGWLRLVSGKVCTGVEQAADTLTQRMTGPRCAASVTLDASGLKDGDTAGLCALQGCYGSVAVKKQEGNCFLVMFAREARSGFAPMEPEKEYARIPLGDARVRLRISADFEDRKDEASFYYEKDGRWERLGITHRLYFRLDHFVGCRFALFLYSAEETGGAADFTDFRYEPPERLRG